MRSSRTRRARLGRGHPGGGFVEQQQPRPAGQRQRHLQLLALPVRQRRDRNLRPLLEPDRRPAARRPWPAGPGASRGSAVTHEPSWRWMPRATVSCAVIDGNRLACCRVWLMPMRDRRTSERSVTSWPSRATVPASARSVPLISLNRVDLPAPFGPIRACRVPAPTARSTPCTAFSAPNERLDPGTAQQRSCRSPPPEPQPGRTAREQVDHQHEDQAEDQRCRARRGWGRRRPGSAPPAPRRGRPPTATRRRR